MTHSAILLILDALACFRLTRLVVEDTITQPVRDRLIGRAYANGRNMDGTKMEVAARPRLAELLSCPWCASPYVAVLIVALQTFAAGVCLYVSAVLAFSAVAGLLARLS